MASYWPSSSLRSRVLTLPRSGMIASSGSRSRSCASRAQARRADARAAGQLREIEIAIGDERVARILALADRREREALGHVHRHVLQRVDGEVGAAFGHRHFELLDEQPLAADVGERLVEHAVALRGEAEQLDLARRIHRGEPRADVLGLPHARARIRAWR